MFAHGKDMYYDGWEDTVQINYGNPHTLHPNRAGPASESERKNTVEPLNPKPQNLHLQATPRRARSVARS